MDTILHWYERTTSPYGLIPRLEYSDHIYYLNFLFVGGCLHCNSHPPLTYTTDVCINGARHKYHLQALGYTRNEKKKQSKTVNLMYSYICSLPHK